MTPKLESLVESSLAAERSGDAEGALGFHRGVPMFRGCAHQFQLTQLAGLRDEMTPWLWARWAAYQCTRNNDLDTEAGRRQCAALRLVTEIFYADRLDAAYHHGDDPVQLSAIVMGEDWAFHQLCTHDLGGLAGFLDLVTGRLADESSLARTWAGRPMGGYRLESTHATGLWVRDLRTDDPIELLDLGARVHAEDDGWLIGRLVPSGTSPSLMFDTRPLPVDEQTAREVAGCEAPGEWVPALHAAFLDGRVERSLLMSPDRDLPTDVPSLQVLEAGTRPPDLDRTLQQLREGRDEIGRAAFRILRSVANDSFGGGDRAPYVAAAVLNAHGYAEAQRLVGPGQQHVWARWADLVPDPARGRLARFAELAVAGAA